MARRDLDLERHDTPGSAVGKDSDEALRPSFFIYLICRFAGIQTLATVYRRKGNDTLLTSC